MIPYDPWAVVCSVAFYFLAKLLCSVSAGVGVRGRLQISSMYKKHHRLSSIPENNETEDETRVNKWVPKKKHEVLKAKYKCLKKLFQIYDASVIGILPEAYDREAPDQYCDTNTHGEHDGAGGADGERRHARRKRRSYRTKTEAGAGKAECGSGDVTPAAPYQPQDDKTSIASTLIRDLKIQCSCSTQVMSDKSMDKSEAYDMKMPSLDTFREVGCSVAPCGLVALPSLGVAGYGPLEPRPTRFQAFLQRLFGLRRDKRSYILPDGQLYAASDNNAVSYSKRRRRGLRFRRLKKSKKVQSELDLRSPVILSYVQSVQRNCLMDRTPRQCPIAGCRNIFYGIINYNDHLNLCHFMERKHMCHYCHEGFASEQERQAHEYEHLGITKLPAHVSATSTARQPNRVSNTQTDPELSKCDVPEEKLKKIVSFFDKIVNTEQMLAELKDNRYSESNLHTGQRSSRAPSDCVTESATSASASDKRTASCGDLGPSRRAPSQLSAELAPGPVRCHLCGEDFGHRRQLSLHVDLEHGVHDKFSKFHSCAGIMDCRRRASGLVKAEAGKLNVESIKPRRVPTSSTLTPDSNSNTNTVVSRHKSEDTLSCDPSTNIIYCESMETVKKPSTIGSLVDRVKHGVASYRWEPGTKIIRV